MATARRVSFRFICDAQSWCQVSRTLLQNFQNYRLFEYFPFFSCKTVLRHHWSNLHNRKMSISLKRKKIFQKEKRHSSVFWKAFQISAKNISLHRHLLYNRTEHSRGFFTCFIIKNPIISLRIRLNFQAKLYFPNEQKWRQPCTVIW